MLPRVGLPVICPWTLSPLSNNSYCYYLVVFHDMIIKLRSVQSSLLSFLYYFWSSSYDAVFIVPVPIYYFKIFLFILNQFRV